MTIHDFIKKYQRLLIALVLVIVPMLGVFYLAIVNKTYYGTDIAIHWQRIMELRRDLATGTIPQFSTHVNNPLGNAFNVFYPYLTLLPTVILTCWIQSPMHLIYAMFSLIWIWISLNSYFSAKSYFRSKKIGLLFSVAFTACSTISNLMACDDDVGEMLSEAFTPLVLFGVLWIMRDGTHWLMLYTGATLLVYSHVISTALMATGMVLLILLNSKRVLSHAKIILAYLKAGILTVLSTALFWVPFIYLTAHNTYYNPKYGSAITYWISGMFHSYSGEFIHENCGFIDLIGIAAIVAALFSKTKWGAKAKLAIRIPWRDVSVWIVGMLFWMMNAHIGIVHNIFANTSLNVLQFSFRTLVPIHIMFTYIAVKWLAGYYTPIRNAHQCNRFAITFVIVLALVMQVGNQLNDQEIYRSRPTYYSSKETSYSVQMNRISHREKDFTKGFTLDDHSFAHILNTNTVTDYSPLNTTTYRGYRSYGGQSIDSVRGNFQALSKSTPHTQTVKTTPNGIKINTHHGMRNVMLPLEVYNGYRYTVTDHNHDVSWRKGHNINYVVIPSVHAGQHLYQIEPHVNKFDGIIPLLLTAIGCGLAFSEYRRVT